MTDPLRGGRLSTNSTAEAATAETASSGKTNRHRLNRGGDRDANRALYLLAVGRMGWDPATRVYVERRTTEGLSKKDILRCLKRYIARELYPLLAGNPALLAFRQNYLADTPPLAPG